MSTGFRSFFSDLRKKRIIEILAAFIAGGWLIIEFVDRILVAHYHFPDKAIDITFITLLCALICTLLWRWFSGREAPSKFKLELVLIPLVVLITVLLDINLLLHLKSPESEPFPATPKWKNSVAVLPFVDMSPQKDQEYFCDGMTEELINRLSNIKELKVPARTSAFMFKGKAEDIREIGRKLDVRTVLEGSIRKEDSQLRITVQLVNASDSFHIWSETFDKELTKVFAIQDEIALTIADKLKLTLLGEQEKRLVKRYTENLEAYKLYLEGLYYWNKRTGKDLTKAIELFNQAIDKDSKYAMAYVGLADSYNLLTIYGDARPLEAYPRAKAAATKALEINQTLAEAHNSLAYVYERYDWNWKAAETEFKRALELNPNYATGHFWYSELLMYLGRFEESIREMKRALELDPVSLIINGSLGRAYFMARQFDQALAQLHETLEMDPNFALTRLILGNAYLAKHQFSEGIDELRKARELSGDAVVMVGTLGVAYATAGKLEEAKGILEGLKARSQKQYVSSYWIGRVFGAIGDVDKLFELWNKAYEERTEWLIEIKSDPSLVPYQSDPRYKAILKKMGFEYGE